MTQGELLTLGIKIRIHHEVNKSKEIPAITPSRLTRACSGWYQHSGGDSKTLATAEAQAVRPRHFLR
jgi:hypothetical protein